MMNMKAITLMFAASLFFATSFAQKKSEENPKSQRVEKNINSQWSFNYFPASDRSKEFESPGFDDSRWPAISILHTWNTFETTGISTNYKTGEADISYWLTGWAWYRKHFSLNREFSGRKIFIQFSDVRKYCKIWLNGKLIGEHNQANESFDFDLTAEIIPGEDNLLAVAVSIGSGDDSKDINGGICGNVAIVLTDKLYIPLQVSRGGRGYDYSYHSAGFGEGRNSEDSDVGQE